MIKLTGARYKIEYKFLKYFNRHNSKTLTYQQEGLRLLEGKVEKLPVEMVFRPRFITQSSCVKVFDKIYLFISKANLYKPASEKFDSFFHEIGHWLHFQDLPPKNERKAIWAKSDLEKIKNDVSEYSTKADDGREFVAEVFKGLIKGKKYDDYIMNLYEKLRGPKVKQ